MFHYVDDSSSQEKIIQMTRKFQFHEKSIHIVYAAF